MQQMPLKTNRFSHAYMHDLEKAYARRALLDFNWQCYVSVAPARQITKISKAVTYLTLHSLKFRSISRPYLRVTSSYRSPLSLWDAADKGVVNVLESAFTLAIWVKAD
ncbi:hypothetical protein, partial [Paraburkholderia aspalathi]|uniref:hypothetical protein n=1 Tax=Paraburkholderia aspalathi TaxID=1324617 RepID=UPI001BADF265